MGRIVRCSVGCRWVLAVGLGWCLLSLAGAPAHAEPAEQVSEVAPAAAAGKLRILLLGDSTIEGSIPRRLKPEGPHVEQVIEQLLAAEGDLPPCEVINVGLSGEYIERLMTSGRYDRVAAPLKDIDYIVVRYGINDRGRVENFVERFPQQYHDLIARLRQDHPGAVIIPSSIIPFANEAASEQVNALIRQVAEREALSLFDIYPAYAEALRVHGHNALNYRRYALDRVPEKYHALVQPFVHGGQVMVMGHELDAILGHLPGWYGDRHPNLAGYNVIAVETVKYLSARIRVDRGAVVARHRTPAPGHACGRVYTDSQWGALVLDGPGLPVSCEGCQALFRNKSQNRGETAASAAAKPQLTEEQVLRIAEPALTARFPERFERYRPYHATFEAGQWTVFGSLPAGTMGATPQARVNDADGKLLHVGHTQ